MSAISNLKFKDGDGEEEDVTTMDLQIQTVTNGWILTATDEDEEEYTEVFPFSDSAGLMVAIKSALGAPGA